MKRTLIVVAAVVGFAAAANAATLSVVSDKSTYAVGETITLNVTGDSQGGSTSGIFGQLNYSAALTDTVTSSQTQHTGFGGGSSWTTGGLGTGEGFADVFNQIAGVMADTVDQLQIATATLVAENAGVVVVSWAGTENPPVALDFFGITAGPGNNFATQFTIVPEPTTAALLGLGLVGLVLGGRRRS